MRVFLASLVAFVGLSVFSDSGAPTLRVTGIVTGWRAGEWISVGNDQNPQGFPIAVREMTAYDPAGIKPGVRVTVWYKSVGERRSVAVKVQVLDGATPPIP